MQDFFFYTIRDFDDDDLNEFSQWTTTDQSNFTHHTENVNEYVNIVVYCNRATTYPKSALLHIEMSIEVPKKLKFQIDKLTVIFLGDSAENYKFVIQDEVCWFHWNDSQYTLYPVVTYYQENDELKNICYCKISDDRKYDVPLVYKVQKVILANLKCKLHGLSTIIYFTDGCAGQYKNWKKF